MKREGKLVFVINVLHNCHWARTIVHHIVTNTSQQSPAETKRNTNRLRKSLNTTWVKNQIHSIWAVSSRHICAVLVWSQIKLDDTKSADYLI